MHRGFTVLAALALSGCLPLSLYYKEGVSVALLDRDTLNCEVKAVQSAPVANQVRRSPPRYVPGKRTCDANGNCTTTGGFYIPGEIYTVDVNASLRQRVEQQCMRDKGYVPADIPACPQSVANAAPQQSTKTLPRLGPKSCVIRYDDQSYQIVNRG